MSLINDDFNKVIAILKYLDLNLPNPKNKKNFESRLIIQKIIFLSQRMGIRLKSYKFGLYKNGPYSPDLTRDYYDLNEFLINLETKTNLTLKEQEILDKLREYVLNHKTAIYHLSDLLEAVATGYYFKFYKPKSTNNFIFRKIKEEKPFISEKIVAQAIIILNKLYRNNVIDE
ncbi:MAG: hypothetical protein ACFFDH_12155 [Promethearchaeota archaeon]